MESLLFTTTTWLLNTTWQTNNVNSWYKWRKCKSWETMIDDVNSMQQAIPYCVAVYAHVYMCILSDMRNNRLQLCFAREQRNCSMASPAQGEMENKRTQQQSQFNIVLHFAVFMKIRQSAWASNKYFGKKFYPQK